MQFGEGYNENLYSDFITFSEGLVYYVKISEMTSLPGNRIKHISLFSGSFDLLDGGNAGSNTGHGGVDWGFVGWGGGRTARQLSSCRDGLNS